jgi:hypothetical protein
MRRGVDGWWEEVDGDLNGSGGGRWTKGARRTHEDGGGWLG